MLRPIPTFFMEDLDMDTLDTPDTSDTMAMDLDTSTARGLLMLRLSLILTMDTMDLDTPDTSDMLDSDTGSDTAECTARGLLMLRLSLILTMDTMDSDTAESSTANRLHQDLSVNNRQDFRQKWIDVS